MAKKKNKEVYVTPEVEITETEEISIEDIYPVVEDATENIPEEIAEVIEDKGMVYNCNSLNIRQEPSKEGKIIGVVFKGDFLIIDHSRDTDDFYGIKSPNGTKGYCMKNYVGIVEDRS